MICPVCGRQMEKGGIIAQKAIAVAWHPETEYEKKGLGALVLRGGKWLGKHYPLQGVVRIPDAWYCSYCKKVTGVFDVTNEEQ